MLQRADELSRADERTDQTHQSPCRSPGPSPAPGPSSHEWSSPAPSSPPPSSPLPSSVRVSSVAPVPAAADLAARPAGADARQEIVVARETRAAGLVGGLNTEQIAAEIHDRCAQLAGTSRIRAYRLALGVSL